TRFLSAQLQTMFGTSLWHRNATNANATANRLADGLAKIARVQVQPPQASTVLAAVSVDMLVRLREHCVVHLWWHSDDRLPIIRLVCSSSTTTTQGDELLDLFD